MFNWYFDQQFYRDADELHRLMSEYRVQTFIRYASKDKLLYAAEQMRLIAESSGDMYNAGVAWAKGFSEGIVIASQAETAVFEDLGDAMEGITTAAKELNLRFAITATWMDEVDEDWYDRFEDSLSRSRGVVVHAPGDMTWKIRNTRWLERLAGSLVLLACRHASVRGLTLANRFYNAVQEYYDNRGEFIDVDVP